MEQVFVVKDGVDHLEHTGTAVTTLDTMQYLNTGGIAIMGWYPTGVFPVTAITPATDGLPSQIVIFQALGDGLFTQSPPITPDNFTINTQEIVAGVPQVVCVGATGSAGSMVFGTNVVGAEYGFEVTDLRQPTYAHRTYSVGLTITNVAITDAEMLTAITAALNANAKIAAICTVTCTLDDTVLFTATDSEQLFTVRPFGLLYGSTVTTDGSGTSTLLVNAIGTGVQVAEAERRGEMVLGRTSTRSSQDAEGRGIWKHTSFADTSLTYNAFTINMKHISEHGYGSPNENPSDSSVTVYYTATDSDAIAAALAYLVEMADTANILYKTAFA